MATARDNNITEHKGHTASPRIEMKIIDPAGSRTRAAGLEGRDSTEHATATDCVRIFIGYISKDHNYTKII